MSDTNRISRRRLLRRAARLAGGAAAMPYVVPSAVLGRGGAVPPSDRIAMGFVGTGGRGRALLSLFLGLKDARVVAVCDVKRPAMDAAARAVGSRYGGAACDAHGDFRELCSRADIDAVAIASPDHWHVLHALHAVRAGKHVYVEKPLGLSVQQGRALRRAVKTYGVVFQFGTQERSAWSTRLACQIVRNGRIGRLLTVKVGSRFSRASENYAPAPVPDGLDYDLWLGPAPWAAYTPNRVVNNWWFHISDYALGFIAGCGIHTVDMARWGCGTERTGCVEVEATGEFPADGLCDCATAWDVNLRFAAGFTMNFTDGGKNRMGVHFQGTDGWVFVKETHLGGSVDAQPKSLLRETFGPGDLHLPASRHHQQDFLDAIRTGREPVAPIDVAVRSDAICQLSDIAMRLGRRLRWDPDRERFIGDPDADRMLHRPMRPPWRL